MPSEMTARRRRSTSFYKKKKKRATRERHKQSVSSPFYATNACAPSKLTCVSFFNLFCAADNGSLLFLFLPPLLILSLSSIMLSSPPPS